MGSVGTRQRDMVEAEAQVAATAEVAEAHLQEEALTPWEGCPSVAEAGVVPAPEGCHKLSRPS